MSFFLILFFASLFGIVFMISRRLVYINHKQKHHEDTEENFLAEILDWNKLRHTSFKRIKQGGEIILWTTLRAYILSLNFLNKKKKEITQKISEKINKYKKHNNENTEDKKEPSKYLNIISEYRQKIRHMKHRIKKEEGIE